MEQLCQLVIRKTELSLTQVKAIFYLYTPENVRKPGVFLTFSGVIEMEHLCEMGQKPVVLHFNIFVMLGTEKVSEDNTRFTTFAILSN